MLKSLSNLNQAEVQNNLTLLKQLVQELRPELHVDNGPFHDTVLYYSAIFATATQQEIADAIAAINISKLARDPDAAHPALVDSVLSNWLVKRNKGTAASGLLTVVSKLQAGLIVPKGTVFTVNDHKFATTEIFHVRAHITEAGQHERILFPYARGTWAFTLPVTGITSGTTSNLRRGTKLQYNQKQMPHVVSAFASEDFLGGADEESNAQMFNRLTRVVGGKVWSNRYTCDALIAKHPKFSRAGISVIGFGDAEMIRDHRGLWPGSTGGRTDVYVKSPYGVISKSVELPGKLVDGLWEISIDNDVASGFYFVSSVIQKDGTPCEFVKLDRSVKIDSGMPDIQKPIEAVYSAYQTATLVVSTPNPSKDEMSFIVDFGYQDGINDLQQFLMSREVASPAGDVLVKAAIPCCTTVWVEIHKAANDPPVNTDGIKTAIADMINATGFVGHIATTAITSAIAQFLFGAMVIKSVTLTGTIRQPDGKLQDIATEGLLVIPTDTEKLISPRTTTFFQSVDDITVNVITAN